MSDHDYKTVEGGMLDPKDGDIEDRLGFVKKVYAILFSQLALTAAYTWYALSSVETAQWMQQNSWLYFTLLFVMIVVQIMLICVRSVSRKVPVNYIMLFIFTACESYFVAWLCQMYTYDPAANAFDEDGYRTVAIAGAMTLGITASLSAYAWTTKEDFTTKMGFLWVFGMVFFMLCIFSIFFFSYILQMVLCAVGVLLFGMYLVVDT